MPSYMTFWWIAAGVIIIVMLLVGRRFKNSTLDKLPLLPNEKILVEAEVEKIIGQTGPQPILYPRCFIRITNQRIILAQHSLFSGKSLSLPIRYVINIDKNLDPTGYGGGALKLGYITFSTARNKIAVGVLKGKKYFEIIPEGKPGPMSGLPYYVKVFTERADEFLHVLI